jgi:hypothetical protein
MTVYDKLINQYYIIRKGTYGYIERIEMIQSVDPSRWNGFRLVIDLRSGTDESSSVLHLEFTGVQGIRIGEITGLMRYMIEIRYVGESQMESKRFRVSESEYDALSFTCESFSATLI